MNVEIPCRSLEDLVSEGQRLLKLRPRCHKMQNDLTAAIFIAQLHSRGYAVEREEAETCIRRMRIAVDTGIYPDDLLEKASAERASVANFL